MRIKPFEGLEADVLKRDGTRINSDAIVSNESVVGLLASFTHS